MPNHNVFNRSNAPLYTQLTNTYVAPGIESGPDSGAAKAGILFSLTSGSVSVGSGQSLAVQVSNPGGSGKTMYVSRIAGGSSAAATITFYSGGTITGGTTPTPVNLLFGNSTASVMTTRVNSVASLGGTPVSFMTVLSSGGIFTFSFTGGVIVPPGSSLTVTVGTGALSASANIFWWEY